MYAAVPRISPACVAASDNVGDIVPATLIAESLATSIALARPKSSTFTEPSGVTLILAGFKSRWMMPRSWAYSIASAICLAMRRASAIGNGPVSVSPSTISMTMACWAPASSRP